MDVIIYSFFTVAALGGISYYVIKQRYSGLLQEEQEKYFSLRNNELQLLSEKQRLETVLREKEQQIADIRNHISSEETKASSLGGEVITKDKQIQSLTAQLQHETQQRTSLQQQLSAVEHQLSEFKRTITEEEALAAALKNEVTAKEQTIHSLSEQLREETEQRTSLQQEISTIEETLTEFRSKVSEEETKATTLSSVVSTKDETIQTLSSELHQQTEVRSKVEQILSQKEEEAALLASRIREEEEKRSALMNELGTKEQQFQSELERKNVELQQTITALQQESELRTSNDTRSQESIRELQHQVEMLQNELSTARSTNETLRQESELRTSNDARTQESIRELQHQVEQLQNELSTTRSTNETLNSSREQLGSELSVKESEYQRKLTETEELYTMVQTDLDRTAEQLREQILVRETTEQALQESKQKLYAVIAELEQKHADQTNAIAALQSELSIKSNDLSLAEQSIHNILRQIPLPVFVVNENGNCEYCNDSLKELVGYGMDELNYKHFSRLFPEEDRVFYEEQWKSTLNRAEQFQGETRILAATGDPISASVNFVDIRPNGEMTKYVGFIFDRTTEKDAKKHFTAAKEREQELLDLKSRFIGMVSNQLRTSLVTMATNTELMERFIDKWSDERRYHSFLRINESIRQMLELVRDVTFTTQATTEQYTLSIAPVNLESLFQTAAKELTADLESHHHFILSEQGNISSVSLDEKLLKTIVTQLLSNAFKYSRDNTEVNAHIELVNSSCIIKISDQGIGIPAAEQKHLFSSFFRASNVSNIYGTGLGLTIAQQCVQMHGGSISVNSELNKGTTVTVSLPVSHNN